MKSNWFPVLLFIVIAGVIWTGLMKASKKNEANEKQFAAYLATEAADSEWIAPSFYIEAEPTGERKEDDYLRAGSHCPYCTLFWPAGFHF